MRDYPVKAPGDTFTAEEFNESIGGELENFIIKSGITLAALTTNQMSQAATLYSGAATFFTESGAADAYIGNVVAPFEAPPSLPNGFLARFFPGNTNTGASTLNLAGTGVKAIVKDAGLVALTGGEIVINEPLIVSFNSGADKWHIIQSGFQVGVGGAGVVDSVFGRTGAVIAVLDDYVASLVDNDSAVTGDTVKDALNTLNASLGGGLLDVQTFPSSGTWTKPAGTLSVRTIVVGGGGGGGGVGDTTGPNGSSGGTSSFGAFSSATGGAGGEGGNSGSTPGVGGGDGGVGSGGDSNHDGGGGGSVSSVSGEHGGAGGTSTQGGGGEGKGAPSNGGAGGDSGGGGGGAVNNSAGGSGNGGAGGGGAGGTAKEHVTAGLGATETITVGAGGAGGIGTGGSPQTGGAGAAGIVIVASYG